MWHYAKNKASIGPVTEEQLVKLIAAGKITGETQVWRQGTANWMRTKDAGLPVNFASALASSAPSLLNARNSRLAISSLILGILSFGFWIVTALPAIICGHIALSKIKKASGGLKGKWLAIAGLVAGYLGFLFGTLVFWLAMLSLSQNVESARHARAAADIRAISTQLKIYESINGFYPTTEQGLRALVVQPGTDPKPAEWSQSFEAVPKDPWHTEYNYVCPGRKHPDSFDLYSSGHDKKQNTADDVWGD